MQELSFPSVLFTKKHAEIKKETQIYRTKDSKVVDIKLEISDSGIKVYKNQSIMYNFKWCDIIKVKYFLYYFYIKVRLFMNKGEKITYRFKMGSCRKAKQLWKASLTFLDLSLQLEPDIEIMDSKEIKLSLKEAREAIKNKDYTTAIKFCKGILRNDKENYMALVFFGISLQEIGPREQAPNAFRKAILISPDQTLAWNGLMNYYEKEESDTASKELISVYEKLLELENDATKFSDCCNKLVIRATKINETSKVAEILECVANNNKINENNRKTAWLTLASHLSQINGLTPEQMELLAIALSAIVRERSTVTMDYYKEYLKLLYKQKKYEFLIHEAINMHSIYESTVYPLEWICKVYVELAIEDNLLVDKFEEIVEQYSSKLSAMQPDSVMSIFVNSVKLFRHKNYIESKDELKKVVSLRAGLTHAWVLYSDCLLILYCYNEAAQAASRADKLLQSMTKENLILRSKVNKILLLSLSHNSTSDKWNQAVEFGEKILDENPNDIDSISAIILACINLEKYEIVEKYLLKVKDNNIHALLKARLLHKQGEFQKALDLLKQINVESCEVFVEIGCLYWSLQDYNSSLIPYLKAAKLNPNYYMCFVYLGRYYDYISDIEKARRCYQKAFKINSRCMEAGIGLSNIYRKQKNWVANLELLQNVTGTNNSGLQIINHEVRWAWLQLGLNYLEQGEFNLAIDSLRSVIRVELNNGHYWECLADAYMARGSYTAAMKSYERAAELSGDSLYSKLQIATIKLMLGYYKEAKISFEILLTENTQYVPALKGLAESCLNLATMQHKDQLLGLCRSNAQYALDQLTIALRERSDLSCLWKLSGDSCCLVASLPEKYSYLNVHCSLAEGRDDNELVSLNAIQLYTLAARCYCKAISQTQANVYLWYDLAKCYYCHAGLVLELQKRKKLLNHALTTARYNVINNPGNCKFWNLLGVIAVNEDVKNYSLAQHAFIKAVTIDKNNAVSWSNLGTLYLMLNNIQLANKAYSKAQRADPNYVNSWVGQALIAEIMNYEDAMDLFRHSTQLGYNSQGALGYAHWVCRTIIEAPPHSVIYSIHNMHAIPISCDVITWYTENNPYDACAWNMLGILKERLGFTNSTLDAFKKSLALTSDKNYDKVLVNCGRILTKLKKYDEAINLYKEVKEATFNEKCGLALALFKDKKYQESYEAYDTTVNWLTENENFQSHILVALAAMAYLFKGADGAKTLLFQSTELKPPSHWGLFAILSLGLLHGEPSMAQLVLKELQPIKDEPEIIYHYSILLALTYLRQGDKKAAIRSLTNSIHRHPAQASLWHFLSILLLQVDAQNKSQIAAKCAQLSIKMGRSQMDITKILGIVSLATCLSNDIKSALNYALKAVHCYPDVAESWAVLITVLNNFIIGENKWPRQKEWLQNSCVHVTQYLNPSDKLTVWFEQFMN